MSEAWIGIAGAAPPLGQVTVVALYEPGTGRIVHRHSAMVFGEGETFPHDEVVASAQAHAAQAGHTVEELMVTTSSDPAHCEGHHRIDPATGEFRVQEENLPSERWASD